MFFTAPTGMRYYDRGNYYTNDYTSGDFTKDGAWHDLDLSGIMGTGRKLVLLSMMYAAETYGNLIQFRTNGNTNEYNVARATNLVGGTEHYTDLWVWTDANGVIEYRFAATTWDTIEVVIRGWFY